MLLSFKRVGFSHGRSWSLTKAMIVTAVTRSNCVTRHEIPSAITRSISLRIVRSSPCMHRLDRVTTAELLRLFLGVFRLLKTIARSRRLALLWRFFYVAKTVAGVLGRWNKAALDVREFRGEKHSSWGSNLGPPEPQHGNSSTRATPPSHRSRLRCCSNPGCMGECFAPSPDFFNTYSPPIILS